MLPKNQESISDENQCVQHFREKTPISESSKETRNEQDLRTKSSEKLSQSSSINFGSGEVSNQYNRCQSEMQHMNLDFLVNKHLQDVTDFEIVPTSSNDSIANASNKKSCDQQLVFHNDNSSNAVDINISIDKNKNSGVNESLSFNGKINTIGHKSLSNDNNKISVAQKIENDNTSEIQSFTSEQSPDMFAEYDDDDDEHYIDTILSKTSTVNIRNDNISMMDDTKSQSTLFDDHINEDDFFIDKALLTNIKKTLSKSVHSSLTIIQYDLTKLLNMYHENVDKNISNDLPDCKFNKQSHTVDEIKKTNWPDIMKVQAHGICYNRSIYSENIEAAFMKFAEKNIGAETSSSFTYSSPSSAKKRAMRMK